MKFVVLGSYFCYLGLNLEGFYEEHLFNVIFHDSISLLFLFSMSFIDEMSRRYAIGNQARSSSL